MSSRPQPNPLKLSFQRQGKGSGVTRVEGLIMHPSLKEGLLRTLKGRLACGGTIDGGALVFQGDHRDRVQKELETLGYIVKRHGG